MIELRKALQAHLKTLHPTVYFQDASNTVSFPYIVFDFPGINPDGENFELAVVDIDGWDRPADGDTTVLENLMKKINDGLDKQVLTASNMAAVLYLDQKLTVPDDDKRIKRRKYVYQVRIFGGS